MDHSRQTGGFTANLKGIEHLFFLPAERLATGRGGGAE
jgi:hypothetical protein